MFYSMLGTIDWGGSQMSNKAHQWMHPVTILIHSYTSHNTFSVPVTRDAAKGRGDLPPPPPKYKVSAHSAWTSWNFGHLHLSCVPAFDGPLDDFVSTFFIPFKPKALAALSNFA